MYGSKSSRYRSFGEEVRSLFNIDRPTTTGQPQHAFNLLGVPLNSPCVQSLPVNKKGPKTQDVGIAKLSLKLDKGSYSAYKNIAHILYLSALMRHFSCTGEATAATGIS